MSRDKEWIFEITSVRPEFASAGSPSIARQRGWMPRIDLLEAGNHILIRVELAGVHQGQVSLTYNAERHTVLIKGERLAVLGQKADKYQAHLLEIEEGAFSREVALPKATIDFGAVRASFRNGILSVILPKLSQHESVLIVERVTVKKQR